MSKGPEPERFDARLAELFRAHGVECVVNEDGVWMPGEGMRAFTAMFWRDATGGQLDVALEPWPGRLVVESFAAVGEDRERAVASAFDVFAQNVLHVWLAAFVDPRDERAARETWTVGGARRQVVHGNVAIRGERPEGAALTEWVPALRRHVEAQPLEPGLHTLRFFHAQSAGKSLVYEALLDNEPWDEVRAAMEQEPMPTGPGYLSVRLFAILQDGFDVRRAAALIAARGAGGADDGEIVEALIARGATPLEAERLAAFIPHAFGRVLVRKLGVHRVEDRAVAWRGEGREPREIDLGAEPIWVAARDYAAEVAERGPQRLLEALALRSAELAAVNQLLAKGSSPGDIGLGPAVFIRLDGPPPIVKPKPWWKVW